MTQDWHTPGHVSFASTHPGKKPFETTKLAYGTQVLWPDHCVQGTDDAALAQGPQAADRRELIIRKGYHQSVDSYSAFMEADGKTSTGLAALPEGARRRHRVRDRARDRLLRRLDGARRAQGRLHDLRRSRTPARGIDLNGSLAAAWEQDDQGRRQAHPVERHLAV